MLPDGVPDDDLATTRKRPRPSCDDKSPPWPVATDPATMHAARAVGAGLSCGAAAIGSSATATPAATRPATVTSLSSTTDTVSAPPSAILLHRQLPRLPLPAGVPSSSLSAFGRLAELGACLALQPHVSRLPPRVSRLPPHISRLPPHVSRRIPLA